MRVYILFYFLFSVAIYSRFMSVCITSILQLIKRRWCLILNNCKTLSLAKIIVTFSKDILEQKNVIVVSERSQYVNDGKITINVTFYIYRVMQWQQWYVKIIPV